MSDRDDHPAELDKKVERHYRRRAQWEKEGEHSLASNLAMIGSLGWLIVTPTLIGVMIGRWIDHSLGSGITATGAFLLVGLAIGCRLAWKRMHQP